jgi:hypothetical protein
MFAPQFNQIAVPGKHAPGRLRSKFTVVEDEQLRSLVSQCGTVCWDDIARYFPGKTVRQVRERYKNYLAPHLNHSPWTEAEDCLLREKFVVYGPQWSILKRFFVNRSDVNVKNRWSLLVSKANRSRWEASVSSSPFNSSPITQTTPEQFHEAPITLDVRSGCSPVVEAGAEVPDVMTVDSTSRRTSFDFDLFNTYDLPFDQFGYDSLWQEY